MSDLPEFRHILIIEDSNSSRRIISLQDNIYTIGRDSSNSISINNARISRYHATLLKQNDEFNSFYVIIDGDLQGNKSTNGIIINGKSTLQQELKHGDLIKFGGTVTASYYIVSNSSVIDFFQVDSPSSNQKKSRQEDRQTIPSDQEPESIHEELIRLASFTELSPTPIIEINQQGEITYINSVAIVKFPELIKAKINHPILSGLVERFQDNQQGNLFTREVKIYNNYYEEYVHILSQRNIIRIYVFDLTQRKQIEAALRESEERYRAVVSQISDGIFLVDLTSKKIIESNQAYTNLIGYSLEEILQLTLDDLTQNKAKFNQELALKLQEGQYFFGEAIHRKKDGSVIDVELSVTLIHYSEKEILCFAVRDITMRKRSQEILQYQAFHDPLTGLPNRTLFNEQLSKALANAKRYKHLMGVMFIDIDHFKNINDTLGHDVGDKLLQGFAERLKQCLRASDTIARRGGDEFTILLPQVSFPEDLAKLAQRLLDALKPPFHIYSHQLEINISIGIAFYPDDGEDAQTLLNHADEALYRTKQQGRNNYQFYNFNCARLLHLENLLSQALDREELFLEYQPILDIKSFQLTGIEALLSWRNSEGDLIFSTELVSLAEKSNLIIPIEDWVLHSACIQNKIWQQAGLVFLPVAVNLSSQQFQQANFAAKVENILLQTELEPRWLELEITEATITRDLNNAHKTLERLLEIGVRLCLDDFGSGSSSVGFLKEFHFHTLKLDRSLIKELKDEPSQMGMISALISLGRGFNIRVVAEGVETQEQLRLLDRLGCFEIQGDIFSQAKDAQSATNFFTQGNYTIPF